MCVGGGGGGGGGAGLGDRTSINYVLVILITYATKINWYGENYGCLDVFGRLSFSRIKKKTKKKTKNKQVDT